MLRRAPLLPAALLLAACSSSPAPAPTSTAPAAPARSEITLLFTSDEHGWVLPRTEHGRIHGGAADMLGLWVAEEGHCPGPPSPPCPSPRTLALSGGDNYTGPAISTYFEGAPMAEAMNRMGYVASAFGNHELDFGRAHFLDDRTRSGMTYLAANLHAPPSLPEMALPPFAIYERRGIKIGVVGLATDTTLRVAMASHFEGITFEREEPALGRAVHDAWTAGADMVVAIIHECPDKLAPILERHPEWKLSFVGAGHCHKLMTMKPAGVPVMAPGWRLDRYVRVRITAEPGQPAGSRVLSVEPSMVDMSRPEGTRSSVPPDAELSRLAEAWRVKVDAVLGEPIGWADKGFEKASGEMGRWIGDAWRAELSADVAIVNGSGLRQNLPRGVITKASVWSILPFDNHIVVVRLPGSALVENLRNKEAVASGVVRGPDGTFALPGGQPIDPQHVYSLVTIDYLYLGGDHFTFKERAVSANETEIDWREPVIAWTKKQHTTKDAPLEGLLR